MRIPYIKYAADYVFPILMIGCILLGFSYIFRGVTWKDIAFWSVASCVYILQIFIYPENEKYLLANAVPFLTSVLPLYFIGLRFDTSKHLKTLYYTSLVNIWTFVVYTLFIGDAMSSEQAVNSGSMHRAYLLLPQVLIVVGYLFYKPTVWKWITTVVGLVFLLMCGNRGSVLLFMVFVVAYMIFLVKKQFRFGVYVGIFAVCAAVSYYFDILIVAMRLLFLQLGMSSRVIEALVSGDFFASNGRNVIRQALTKAISENPIFGYGIAHDRLITGSYAHNLVLELWVSFGVIVGTVLLLAIVYMIVKAWLESKEREEKLLLLVLICVGVLKLFISSSYLEEGMFFLLLGVCVNCIRKSKFDKILLNCKTKVNE